MNNPINKPRKQVLPLETYLNKLKTGIIKHNAPVQRLSDQWSNSMINELIYTVLTDDYIPPLILAEDTSTEYKQTWLIDGLQRTSSLMMFLYGNKKITSSISNPIISFQRILTDNNSVAGDEDNIIFENATFDLRNKTYEKLPVELQQKFKEYQLDMTIFENCTQEFINNKIRILNNHKPMTANQKAFTNVPNYAVQIRDITRNNNFFKDCININFKDRKNGTIERIVIESIMCLYHFNKWGKIDVMSNNLNQYGAEEDFNSFKALLDRLYRVLDKDTCMLFTKKNAFLLFVLFDKYKEKGLTDKQFQEFLKHLPNLCRKEYTVSNEYYIAETDNKSSFISYYQLEKSRAGKESSAIVDKLSLLLQMTDTYFN